MISFIIYSKVKPKKTISKKGSANLPWNNLELSKSTFSSFKGTSSSSIITSSLSIFSSQAASSHRIKKRLFMRLTLEKALK